jgi:fructosamine-3-kinase
MSQQDEYEYSIRAEIERVTGQAVADIAPLSGGCVGQVYRLKLADGQMMVAKVDERQSPQLDVEAFMLNTLSAHSQLPVPTVYYSSPHLLLMSYLPGDSQFNAAAQQHAAELLAALHTITAPTYGLERDTLIGGLRQPNQPTASWLDFFREQRLLYMGAEAMKRGGLPGHFLPRLARLGEQLEQWLVEPERPSLIHGDVWTTNVLAQGDRITGFVDPAIYYADPEIELAFTTLFGTFGRPFFERYQAIRPIRPGFFEERRDLYNLYPLLVHVRLFGGSYIQAVDRILRHFGF